MGKIRKWPHTSRKRLRKRPEKTLSLHLRLIFGTVTAHNNSFFFFFSNEQNKQQTPGKSAILISRVTALLDLNAQFSMDNHKTYKEQEIMANSRGKKKSVETVPEKVLKTLKQLSERCSKN